MRTKAERDRALKSDGWVPGSTVYLEITPYSPHQAARSGGMMSSVLGQVESQTINPPEYRRDQTARKRRAKMRKQKLSEAQEKHIAHKQQNLHDLEELIILTMKEIDEDADGVVQVIVSCRSIAWHVYPRTA
jgi:hypothetical protein